MQTKAEKWRRYIVINRVEASQSEQNKQTLIRKYRKDGDLQEISQFLHIWMCFPRVFQSLTFPFIKGFIYQTLGQAEPGAAAQTDLSPSPHELRV